MEAFLFICLWIVFFLVLYLVVKAAVRHGVDSSHTHRIIQEYIDAKIPEKAGRKPIDQETFNKIYDFSKGQNIPLQEIINTPFDNIYLIKTKEEHFFLHVGEQIMLVEQEDVNEEWKQWMERL